jgi:lipopolysaccharide assembly protein A
MKYFMWLLKAAIFFTLFAFALNNQHDVQVHFFFGRQWHGPLVLVVLATLALGIVIGALGMVPRWWRQRKRSKSLFGATSIMMDSTLDTRGAPDYRARTGSNTSHHGL